jgi:hypothetical protein
MFMVTSLQFTVIRRDLLTIENSHSFSTTTQNQELRTDILFKEAVDVGRNHDTPQAEVCGIGRGLLSSRIGFTIAERSPTRQVCAAGINGEKDGSR